MKQIILLFLAVFTLAGCSENSLKKEFDCKNASPDLPVKEYRDILKKFTLELPAKWKTQLYYDEYSSEIFSADTTKSLTKSYIFDVIWMQGELSIDDSFIANLNDSLQQKEQLRTIRSGKMEFQKKPGYWNLSEGERAGHTYHYLQIFTKVEPDAYLTASTKVFGDSAINERLCESISLLDNIKFLK
ncbi:MAG: membrane lipoprotein lipid attachment site-containing protein [Flavobacteriaceae bacterium]|nr:membrane lipoprotein lipid attachment site-containing protein [Flavobacteriaceae bacterium]